MTFDALGPIVFGFLAGVIVLAGAAVVLINRITSAALFMALTFLGVAGMFLLLGTEALALFQVLIYVGAITILILYGVMFTPQNPRPYGLFFQRQTPLAVAIVAVIAVPVVWVAATFADPGKSLPPGGDIGPLGTSLFGTYAFPFEVASVLLLAAMIGAIVLVKRDDDEATSDFAVRSESTSSEQSVEAMRRTPQGRAEQVDEGRQ